MKIKREKQKCQNIVLCFQFSSIFQFESMESNTYEVNRMILIANILFLKNDSSSLI